MPGPWITDAAVMARVADLLSKDVADLDPKWVGHCHEANQSAANDILGRLLARGFAAAQVDAWDRRVEFNTDIAYFWAVTKGGALGTFSDVQLVKLDRRKELDTVPVMINGALVNPGVANVGGGAAGGMIDETGFRLNMDTQF